MYLTSVSDLPRPVQFAYDAHKGYWAHHNSFAPNVL
jgi:hypothetical protein